MATVNSLDNCLDLKQIHGENAEFFVKQGVKIGAARRFIIDIGLWLKHREQNKESGNEYCREDALAAFILLSVRYTLTFHSILFFHR
jgi:hypothetical protein